MIKRRIRVVTSLLLIFTLVLTQLLSTFTPSVYAASTPWAQTDWSGGDFDSSSNVVTSTAGQVTLSIAEKLTNTGFDSNTTGWSVAAVPPSGWVEVPGDSNFSTTNFLAMKYEAKCAATSALTTGLTSPEISSYNTYNDGLTACTSANTKQVVSVASGYPIANISHTNALTRCGTVSLNGNASHLLRNDEYMTIARNAEAQTGNWTLGSVGSGYLFAGHNDNFPAKARIASTTDTGDYRCAFTDTAGTTENPSSCPTNTAAGASATAGNQVRTLTLSNGVVIWDIAGNAWEHVQRSTDNSGDTTTAMNPLPACTDNVAGWGWCQYGSTTTPYVSAWTDTVAVAKVGSITTSYNSTQGMGQVYTYKNGTTQNASVFLRGGNWNGTTHTGAFTLFLGWGTSNADSAVGLRCVSDPVAISQSFSSSSGRFAAGGNTVTIGSVSDGKLYQSVNVGDTSTYNFSAYVYNNTAGSVGGTVDTNVAQLYYGGNTITNPAWTAVDGETGWYKLTGTVTGIASAIETGLLVKAGKTVYIDDVSLSKEYNSSGTLTSSIFDSEFSIGAAWGTLTYNSSGSTVAVKARTSDSASMVGATAFASCSAITSGSDISSNTCITDGHRYIQHQLTLSTSDTALTPTFSDISIAFATYDADAPSISLTSLATDPNSDATPTLSGTATDSVGTISNVQFQMDVTSGSWTACTATDGSFNSASEAFSCTPSALADGSHTMYVRATDSNGNTTSSSYASDAFTIDATNPVSIDLDSPGDNSYTNNERPTYKWKATTDATAGLSKYVLEIDNPSIGSSQPSGDFTIDNIPTSGTTDITSNNKYVIHFENFNDSDSTNNYISVYTRSTNDWGSSENDGKLREGRVSWKVKAVDNAGNETSSSRTLFIDRTNPSVEFTQINSTPYTSNNFSTTDKTPTIFGKITDPLAGADPVASGPKEVNIKIEKKTGLTYSLVTLYKINMDNPYYTCDTGKTIDNSKQKCDKYLPFEYTPKENLDFGTYKITLSGKDKADNSSGEVTLTLNITTFAQITSQSTSEESKPTSGEDQTPGEAPIPTEVIKPDEEGNITIPTVVQKPNAFEKAGVGITQAGKNIIQGTGNLITTIFTGIGRGLSFVFDKTGQGLAFIGNGIGTGLNNIAQAIGQGYSQLANNAPGFTKDILLAIGSGFSTTGNFIATAVNNIGTGINNVVHGTREGIANLAFGIGEKTDDVSHGLGTAIIKIGYLFIPEPTKIANVKVAKSTPTSMTITWETNHPANGKVNYGLDETYPKDIQTDKRTTYHEFTLTNLTPNTEYHFEVMSQNKNYVYDANRKFITPAK